MCRTVPASRVAVPPGPLAFTTTEYSPGGSVIFACSGSPVSTAVESVGVITASVVSAVPVTVALIRSVNASQRVKLPSSA